MPSVTQLPLFSNSEPQPKRCPKCKEWYPLTNEFWIVDKRRKSGFASPCRLCTQKYHQQYYIDNIDHHKSLSRQHYQDNKQYHHEMAKQWREANIDHKREMDRQYRKLNPDKAKNKLQEWKLKNPHKFKAIKKRWEEKNPDKLLAKTNRYRARKKGNGGSYTQSELKAQFNAQQGRCFHCKKWMSLSNSKTCHIDHWIPLSKGGSNNIENIRLLCPFCNLSKKDKLPCEWHKKYL